MSPEQRDAFAFIETEAKKAEDALWHASEAIATRSPNQVRLEMRRALEAIERIAERARIGALA